MNDTEKYTDEFVVDVTGESTGEKFSGKFKVRTRFSFRDHLKRDQLRAEILGQKPETAYARAASMAEMFAELAMRVIEAPTWWRNSNNGIDLGDDDNLIIEIHKAALKCEADLKAKLGQQGDAAKKELQADAKANATTA